MRDTSRAKPEGYENYFTTGELSSRIGVTRRRIRELVRQERIEPAELRTDKGWALWSPEQVKRIQKQRLQRTL